MRMNDMTPRRRATNISLDQKLVEEARALGVNVSRACEAGLAQVTKTAREVAFVRDNAAAFAAWRDYHDKFGLPFADLRQF